MNPKYIINRLIFRFKNYGFLNTLKKSIEFFFQDKKINLDLINLPNNEKLENIFLRFGTDKANLDGKKTRYPSMSFSENFLISLSIEFSWPE